MKTELQTLATLLATLAWWMPQQAHATTDGGSTAHLIALAGPDRRYAVIAEEQVQEDCDDAACRVFVVDLEAPRYRAFAHVTLPARSTEIVADRCEQLDPSACREALATQLDRERKAEGRPHVRLLRRYLEAVPSYRRTQLESWVPMPFPKLPSPPPSDPDSWRTTEFLGPNPGEMIRLALERRWTVASYRAHDENARACSPERLASCRRAPRWVDGARSSYWVCDRTGGELDCAGRATMLRAVAHIEARPSKERLVRGSSVLVAPGELLQAQTGESPQRNVLMAELQIDASAFRLEHAIVIVGGIVDSPHANGTWFPLVVVISSAPEDAEH